MKKIFLTSFLFTSFLSSAFGSTIVHNGINPYALYCNGCTPGATENDVDNTGLVQAGNDIYVRDTVSGNIFWYKTGSNGSYQWTAMGPITRSFNNAPGRSTIVTTAAAANGFQVSSSRDAIVNYSVTITTTVQIGVATNVDGYVILEIAATNSSTAGDWTEIARVSQAQNIGLALALSSAQKGGGQIGGVIPAGYYARLRSVNVAGTPTYTYNSGQEVLL